MISDDGFTIGYPIKRLITKIILLILPGTEETVGNIYIDEIIFLIQCFKNVN